jgi:cysteine-rich repeat protein
MGNLCFVLANPEPYCGDGLLDGDNGEQCDDGNRKGGDGCSGDCRVELNWGCTLPGSCKPIIGSLDAGYCGDGVKSGDEECDYGADNRSLVDAYYSSCLQDCTLGPRCGDGVAQPPFEQCDEYLQTTTCSANCMNLIPVL